MMAIIKKTSVGNDVENLEPNTLWADRKVKYCSHFGKQTDSSSKESLYDPASPLIGMYPREVKTYGCTKTYRGIFIAALSIISKKCKKLNVH